MDCCMVEWSIEQRPSYSVLKVRLSPGESVTSEAGAMMLMRGGVEIKTAARGGLFGSLLRGVAAGESIFMNTYVAREGGEVWFVPPYPGDIHYLTLDGGDWIVQDTSYLAHHGDVRLGVAWRGLKGLLSEGELVWLKLEGMGGVWLTAFGAIEAVDVAPGERIIVDNFHFVAMPANTRWSVKKFGGWKSTILGGEGLVFEVEGPTRLYLQTRILPLMAKLLSKFLPKR